MNKYYCFSFFNSSGEHNYKFSHSNIPIPPFPPSILSCSPTSQYYYGNCQKGTTGSDFCETSHPPLQKCEIVVPFGITTTSKKKHGMSKEGFNLEDHQEHYISPHQPISFLCETDLAISSSPLCSPSIYVVSQQSSQQWGEYYT